MSGLLDALSSANSGLAASEAGLEVAGQNLANINTPGYTRRVVQLAEMPAANSTSAGRGVDVVSVTAARDAFTQARIWAQQPAGAYDDATVSTLTNISAAVGLPGSGLDSQLDSFFDAFSTLANDPTSAPSQDNVVSQGEALASAFNQLSGQLTSAQQNADSAIGADVNQINQLTTQIASLNGAIAANSGDAESLRDERDQDITTLSGLIGVTVTQDSDGSESLSVGNGRALVVGTQAYALTTSQTPPNGFLAIKSDGVDITSEISTGQIGGLLNARDTLIPGYQQQLDQLAYSVATSVNTAETNGYDVNGDPGTNFFTPLAGAAGAAAALTVNPTVAANGALIAASSDGTAGNNDVANAIADLRNQTIVNGATPDQAWGQFAYSVGTDIANAQSSSTTSAGIMQQLQALLQQTSGVSTDEEATNLIKFQQSYEASARYFTTVLSTLDVLMSMVQE